ncbi:hypothetical protein ET475_00690 [Microbacterium protaetiae]|uniref:Transcription regulator PadR N-terminal domain-containing protein n=1 Tax=Microbacterium protaetiae TaxID=2509458 RepID=A0A4P6EAX5_9MICO|nr:helix-turn-helix transcriptional regulator [Microbacterium protaetiae]QAY58666.1 hypothetical protein ET475_00690 [Microbacterium protaetiae]
MPTNALANPLVLPILGLLVEQPRHPYAVFAELRRRYEYLRVRNATVYTLLNTLARAGWVEEVEQQTSALSTTEAGRDALAERVATELGSSSLSSDAVFMTALAYIGILAPDDAIDALRARRERIRIEQKLLADTLERVDASQLHMIEAHYYLDRLRHDAAWIERTIDRIRDGSLAWR